MQVVNVVCKMWRFCISVIFFSVAVFASDVIELTDADFDDKVKDQDIMLIEFFAPW